MTDTEPERTMRNQFKKIEKIVSESSDEVLISAIDIIGEELQKRSDKQIKYHADRRRKIQ